VHPIEGKGNAGKVQLVLCERRIAITRFTIEE
jgi:hypothetical protein